MPDVQLNKFLLNEALRQDAAVHKMAAQLATKNGLLLIFAAFVLAAESTFIIVSLMFGLQLPRWGWGGALLLCIASIGILLRSVWLEEYSIPPPIPFSKDYAGSLLSFDEIKELSNEQQLQKFEETLTDSVSGCIRNNLKTTEKVLTNLKLACCLLGASVLCLVGCLLWILV